MNKILLLLSFISAFSFAQEFQPFNEDVPKRFFNPSDATDNDYYFYSYKEKEEGDAMRYYQYFRRTENQIPFGPDCSGWGDSNGNAGDTTWLGREIVYNFSTETLEFSNELEEALTFDFSIELGDSALFYANAANEYYIKYTSISSMPVYETDDLVKTFTILHYNLDEEVITSNLHGFEIQLGQNLGLIQFMNCNEFPEKEVGLSLLGQLYPTIGKYQMTYDEAFPWKAGDLLQYRSVYSDYSFGSVVNTTYKTLTITAREETADSVFIYHESSSFTYYVPGEEINPFTAGFAYPNPIRYKKGENISDEPSGMMPYENPFQVSDSLDRCGSRERLQIIPDFNGYCDSCQCDIGQDGFGTTLYPYTYTTDFGITFRKSVTYGDIMTGTFNTMIYAKIDDVECGSQAFMSLDEHQIDFELYPNPTTDLLHINAQNTIEEVRILSPNGQVVYSELISNQSTFTIDVGAFPKGVYIIELISDDAISFDRFVKE